MASNPASAQKSSSRWGSFLSSVESRLDTILADDDPKNPKLAQKQLPSPNEQEAKKDGTVSPSVRSNSPARLAPANRAQERLNERLAKALAYKNATRQDGESVASSGAPSRTVTPANGLESPQDSSEIGREDIDLTQKVAPRGGQENDVPSSGGEFSTHDEQDPDAVNDLKGTLAQAGAPPISTTPGGAPEAVRRSVDSPQSTSTRQSLENTRSTTPNISESPKLNGIYTEIAPKLPEEYEKTIEQLRTDNEAAELRRQEETHAYLERIDALQAKLQYLTKEAAEIAKAASAEAKPGSPEQKIAAKDEKIALLIEEGQKLSQTELKHMTLIKKLRAKSIEDERLAGEAKRLSEKHEKSASDNLERAKRAQAAEKQALERTKSLQKLERELDVSLADRDFKDSLIRDLQLQLSDVTSAAKLAEEKAQAEALESERKRASDLAEELSMAKTDKDSAEKEHQRAHRELTEKLEREKERMRIAEMERQGEHSILESRLEAYRARAEEVSAGQGSDVQAKLLRQIETLQNQSAVASENWQGIEGTLLSRVTALEKERDDLVKREAEIRKKARDANTKYKRMEDEFELATLKARDLDSECSSMTSHLTVLQERLSKTEAEASAAHHDLKMERESWESRQAQRLEEERTKWREEMMRNTPASVYSQFRSESPILQTRSRKSSNAADRPSPHNRRISGVHGLAISGTSHPAAERPLSRYSSKQRLTSGFSDQFHPPRQTLDRHDSMSTVPDIAVNNGIPETPSVDYDSPHPGDDDYFFSNNHTPATPPERTINDLVSVSTAGAGPSVQLVERMSAAVRRLESEKAAHKDELARIGQQRDEAREQVVELMRDNEGKRAVDERVKSLDMELQGLKGRYETTLEMLGEKSERVEELKADIVDLKALLREMVEERVK